MAEHRDVDPNEDPVCGMRVDIDAALSKGLATVYEDHQYVFCGKGCFLDFRDEPEKFLGIGYTPMM